MNSVAKFVSRACDRLTSKFAAIWSPSLKTGIIIEMTTPFPSKDTGPKSEHCSTGGAAILYRFRRRHKENRAEDFRARHTQRAAALRKFGGAIRLAGGGRSAKLMFRGTITPVGGSEGKIIWTETHGEYQRESSAKDTLHPG
jgi:hypothetical protein